MGPSLVQETSPPTERVDWWRETMVKLLAKQTNPKEFKLLLKITILESNSKWFSIICNAEHYREFDVRTTRAGFADTCMLGFRSGHQCAELVSAIRNSVQN